MKIDRNGSRPSTKGAQDYVSGSVRVEPVFQVGDPMRLNAGSVTFEPGARTAWHTHPLGQTLIITAGFGWVQTEGGQIEEVRPGDVVWFPPGEKHWHGATPTTAMTHIAVQESLNGKNVDWMEKVSDAQYSNSGEASYPEESGFMRPHIICHMTTSIDGRPAASPRQLPAFQRAFSADTMREYTKASRPMGGSSAEKP